MSVVFDEYGRPFIVSKHNIEHLTDSLCETKHFEV